MSHSSRWEGLVHYSRQYSTRQHRHYGRRLCRSHLPGFFSARQTSCSSPARHLIAWFSPFAGDTPFESGSNTDVASRGFRNGSKSGFPQRATRCLHTPRGGYSSLRVALVFPLHCYSCQPVRRGNLHNGNTRRRYSLDQPRTSVNLCTNSADPDAGFEIQIAAVKLQALDQPVRTYGRRPSTVGKTATLVSCGSRRAVVKHS